MFSPPPIVTQAVVEQWQDHREAGSAAWTRNRRADEPRQLLSAAHPASKPVPVKTATAPVETITLAPSTTYQTVQGWLMIGANAGPSPFQVTQGLNMLVNDLGITGVRLEAPAGNLDRRPVVGSQSGRGSQHVRQDRRSVRPDLFRL